MSSVCSIRVFDQNFGIYVNGLQTNLLNTFVMELAQRCSENGGPTVLSPIVMNGKQHEKHL